MESKKTLIIGAHADDMEISCGMFVAHLAKQNIPVKSMIVALDRQGQMEAHGEAAKATPVRSIRLARQAEAIEASKILGINSPLFLEHYIGQIDYDRLREELKTEIESECPRQVLTHHLIDTHFDHAITGMIVNDIFQHDSTLFDLYFWKSPGSYSFVPTDDFTGDLTVKCEALRVHESQGFGNHTVVMMSAYPTEYFIKAMRRTAEGSPSVVRQANA